MDRLYTKTVLFMAVKKKKIIIIIIIKKKYIYIQIYQKKLLL